MKNYKGSYYSQYDYNYCMSRFYHYHAKKQSKHYQNIKIKPYKINKHAKIAIFIIESYKNTAINRLFLFLRYRTIAHMILF